MIGGISGWQLLILLLIVVLVFGTKRLRNIGGDLGSAVRSFRKGLEEGEESSKSGDSEPDKLSADAPQQSRKPADSESRQSGTDV